ncbi:Hypothetical protein A7982_11752 [Minicystis rosea]|nr:Hypothetical protein A7982_11752 [Minicystis rosea]
MRHGRASCAARARRRHAPAACARRRRCAPDAGALATRASVARARHDLHRPTTMEQREERCTTRKEPSQAGRRSSYVRHDHRSYRIPDR